MNILIATIILHYSKFMAKFIKHLKCWLADLELKCQYFKCFVSVEIHTIPAKTFLFMICKHFCKITSSGANE